MKAKILCSIIACFLLGFAACKTDTVDTLPQLKLHVVDKDGNSVSQANVALFDNQNDWQNNTNTISSAITDNDGNALFSNLDEEIYFFWVEKDGLNNNFGTAAVEKSLSTNTIA
ncbi:MAG: carboxypeptidase-like regulatory domain-containing protein, partial [Bacteroidales bacterium]